MEKFKGTKGKWIIRKSESNPAWNVINSTVGHKFKVARCPYIKDLSPQYVPVEIQEAKANALLISKAPEMLEMLIEIRNQIEDGRTYITKEDINKLIKSATDL